MSMPEKQVPWPLVEELLSVGNMLADVTEAAGDSITPKMWDRARVAVRDYQPQRPRFRAATPAELAGEVRCECGRLPRVPFRYPEESE